MSCISSAETADPVEAAEVAVETAGVVAAAGAAKAVLLEIQLKIPTATKQIKTEKAANADPLRTPLVGNRMPFVASIRTTLFQTTLL
jgi:hypothetical protein